MIKAIANRPKLLGWLLVVGISVMMIRSIGNLWAVAPSPRPFHKKDASRRNHVWRSVIGLLITACILLAGLLAYWNFRSIRELPSVPEDAGEVQLFFDRPGIDATLEATLQSIGDQVDYEYHITINGPASVSRLGFSLSLHGHPVATAVYPNGERRPEDANGCTLGTIDVLPEIGHECYEGQGDPGASYADEGQRPKVQVIQGTLVRNSSGFMFGHVSVYSRAANVTTRGKRTFFNLPSIGTEYVPISSREVRLNLGIAHPVYVPKILNVIVLNGKLGIEDRPENISPTLLNPPQLLWYQSDSSSLQAQGSYVNSVKEDEEEARLFILGVIAALLSAALLSALTYTGKSALAAVVGDR